MQDATRHCINGRWVAADKTAFPAWAATEPEARVAALERLMEVYNGQAEDMAQAISVEVGAPIALAKTAQVGAGARAPFGGTKQSGNGPNKVVQDMPWDPMQDFQFMWANTQAFMSLFRAMKPVICKVHGFAVAGGSDIALCADLAIMSDTAQIGYMPTRVWG